MGIYVTTMQEIPLRACAGLGWLVWSGLVSIDLPSALDLSLTRGRTLSSWTWRIYLLPT